MRRFSASLLLVLVLLITIYQPAIGSVPASPDADWSPPTPLSPTTQTAWFPDIAADAAGRVHVAWATTLSTGVGQAYDVVMYASAASGAPWPNAQDIVALPSKGAVTRPSLLADDQGLLHLTFRSYTVFYSHAPVQSPAPATLLPARPISSADNGYFSRLALDKQGRLHVVYTENIQSPSCTGCFHVFYRWSDDKGQSWSPPLDISRLPTGAAKPQLVIDAAGNLHVAWEAGTGGDLGQLSGQTPIQVMVASSYDRGQSWSLPAALAAIPTDTPATVTASDTPAPTQSEGPTPTQSKGLAPTQAKGSPTPLPATPMPTATATANATAVPASFKNIALGVDGQGKLVAAYLAVPEDRVYFQVSADQGRSWSDAQPIAGVRGGWTVYESYTDDYSMVTDSAGVVHLVLVGRTASSDTTLSVLQIAWDGSSWGPAEAIATLSGDVPEWPRAAVGLGNDLHVVWFVRDQAHIFGGEGAALYRVWYAHKLLSAPAQTAAVWPTLAPGVSASATPVSAVNPSPEPATIVPASLESASSDTPSSNLVYNELGYLKVIARGLIPALLIIALVLAVVVISRR